jgi:hypothetical protein
MSATQDISGTPPAVPSHGGYEPLPPAGGRLLVRDPPATVLPSRALAERDGYLVLAPPSLEGLPVPLPLDRPLTLVYRVRGHHYETPAVVIAPPSDAANAYVARVTGAPVRLDRRKAERVRVDAGVQVAPGSGRSLSGRAVNLSSGGALVEIEDALPVGENATLTLNLGSAGLLRCGVEVLRVDPEAPGRAPRVALGFRHIAIADRRRFLRFLIESGLGNRSGAY